ncbi:hypothetical protein HJFPF1_03652 [Paramyrothecium foliicola]|nr:hypothetical protein HJFPF1_03652 [Paramyrothecium foliicola]
MPIGDLLAQISGGASEPASLASTQRPVVVPKRKADDDLRNDISKTPRRLTPPFRTSQPSQSLQRPSNTPRPTNEASIKRDAQPSKPGEGGARAVKPMTAPSRPSSAPPNGSSISKPAAAPARPTPAATSNAAASKVPPKKGSFAEILARGQRAQAVMGQVGKIQHKKVGKADKAPVKKDPKEKKDARPGPPAASKPQGYAGSARAGTRPGPNGHSLAKPNRNGSTQTAGAGKFSAKADEEPKKIRKAAAATTGYAGTARARAGTSSSKNSGNTPRGGALLNAPPPRPSNSRRSRYDDYDEDMDDFIDYDDEEEEDQPRYGYASDESSDMEAGLDELDYEERKAERIARDEDIKEDLLEKRLKAAKEDRKRQALEAMRSGKRH